MMPRGMSDQVVGLLSTTMTYCSLGTSHSMACHVQTDGGGGGGGEHNYANRTEALYG